jgi:hypothetical protein
MLVTKERDALICIYSTLYIESVQVSLQLTFSPNLNLTPCMSLSSSDFVIAWGPSVLHCEGKWGSVSFHPQRRLWAPLAGLRL